MADKLKPHESPRTHAYIGKCQGCGNVVYVTVDGYKDTGKDVAKAIKAGLIIERVEMKDIKMKRCSCDKRQSLFEKQNTRREEG